MKFLTVILLVAFSVQHIFAYQKRNPINSANSVKYNCEGLQGQLNYEGALMINGRLYANSESACTAILGSKASVTPGLEITDTQDSDVELCQLNYHCQISD